MENVDESYHSWLFEVHPKGSQRKKAVSLFMTLELFLSANCLVFMTGNVFIFLEIEMFFPLHSSHLVFC